MVDFVEFRSRALKEGLRYGGDRNVFLRELAQNSRDAGASKIEVTAAIAGDDLVVEFMDDGAGMSAAHARDYLFTLYASSKEDESRSAGKYGVGFWSVLLFEPRRIVIESMTEDGEGWAMAFDGELREQRKLVCNRRSPGTRVELKRPAAGNEDASTVKELERSFSRFCRHLRRNNKTADPLPAYFNGVRVDKPFSVDGPCWMSFKEGPIEGAVGLGTKPRVDLYARGLLVWRGATLDQLRYSARIEDDTAHPIGLAPVYVLNGNDLSVTLDRRAVVDDGSLRKLRRVARRRMRELLGRYLDSISPRPFFERLKDTAAGFWEEARLSPGFAPVVVAVIAAVAIGIGVTAAHNLDLLSLLSPTSVGSAPEDASTFLPAQGSDPGPAPLIAQEDTLTTLGTAESFNGPMVDPLGAEATLKLSYEPAGDFLIRTSAARTLHPGLGVVSRDPVPVSIAPGFQCKADCVDFKVSLFAGPGIVVVPVPTGHKVEPESLRLDGVKVGPLMHTDSGEPVLSLASQVAGYLEYRSGPAQEGISSEGWTELMTVPAQMRLPATYSRVAADAVLEADLEKRAAFIADFVRRTIVYDRSATTVSAYNKFLATNPEAGWMEFVTTLAKGDCDVKNTMAVLLLRRSGIPARLAIGVVGKSGRAEPGMHAWVEYHDRGWIPLDATGSSGRSTSASNEPSPSPESPSTSGDPSVSSEPDVAPINDFVEEPPAQEDSPLKTLAILAGAAAGLLALLAVLLALFGGRGGRRVNAPGGEEVRRKVIAQMISNALVRPEIWLKGSGLSSRELLPVLGGKKMSLDEAVSRGKKGTLWHSGGKPGPVRRAVAKGARILDSHDRAFGDIVVRLGGVVSLDELFRLRPTLPDDLPEERRQAGELARQVDELLGLAGWPENTVVLAEGLKGSLSRDVSLAGLPLGDRGGLPARFVALSPTDQRFEKRLALWREDPDLATFLLLDLIISRSELLRPEREALLRKASRHVLEEAI